MGAEAITDVSTAKPSERVARAERGLRLKVSLLTDNYLILIDFNENRMFLQPMIKDNTDCLRQEMPKIPTAMYITQPTRAQLQ